LGKGNRSSMEPQKKIVRGAGGGKLGGGGRGEKKRVQQSEGKGDKRIAHQLGPERKTGAGVGNLHQELRVGTGHLMGGARNGDFPETTNTKALGDTPLANSTSPARVPHGQQSGENRCQKVFLKGEEKSGDVFSKESETAGKGGWRKDEGLIPGGNTRNT